MSLPITAVVTCHDYARFLPEALRSVLEQDHPAELLDVVVVDDGSTDGSLDIVRGFADAHPRRVTVLSGRNEGYVRASARGLSAARGEIVALLDADDAWHRGHASARAALFAQRREVELVYGDLRVVDQSGALLAPSLFAQAGVAPLEGRGLLASLLSTNVAISSSIAVRARLLERALPFPDGVAYVDCWLATRAAHTGALACTGVDTDYRRHGANMSHGAGGERARREIRRTHGQRRAELRTLRAGDLGAAEALRVAGAFLPLVLAAADMDGGRLADARPAAGARACAEAWRLLAEDGADAAAVAVLQALAEDGSDAGARAVLDALRDAAPADPLADARSRVVAAMAAELVADPALLGAFAGEHDAEADVSLVIWAPGGDPAALAERLGGAIEAAGADCDMLAVTAADTPVLRRALAARADAVLSRRDDVRGAFGLPAWRAS